jgi:competence ComEA-like helix-hairpin-helix protein
MKHRVFFILGIAASTLVLSTLIAAAPAHQAAAQQGQAAADDPAAAVFAETCAKCHDGARITAMRRTSADWEDIIKKMIEKGAPGTEKDFETIYDYLLRHYGKLNINSAPASEIVTILGLTQKEADGLLAYRKSNGPFADFDAVKKVPEIDVKKLDERKDAITF